MLGKPRTDAFHGGDIARLVELPKSAEAPQLAVEIAAGLAKALEARRAPIDGVDLDKRVDQLLADPFALLGSVERGGCVPHDHLALHALHQVEGAADQRLVLAHRKHARYARPRGSSARNRRASRSTSWALGGSGGRGGRRSTSSRGVSRSIR